MRAVCRWGVFIRHWLLILLLVLMLLLVVVSMIRTMVMMMVAIRRRSITLATQERSHRQLVVKLHIRSSGHIHGRGELSNGIGKFEVMMLFMLMITHRRRRSTARGRRCADISRKELLLPGVELLGVEESSGWKPSTRLSA